MRLLIAGGAGFIGSNFCHAIERHGHRGVVVDALTYAGSQANIADISEDVLQFVHGDIRDAEAMDAVFRRGLNGELFDAVVNFAAESHVDRSISDAMPFVSTNVMGAVTLLEAARVHAVPMFLQISTDEVYGSIAGVGKSSVSSRLDPSSAYAASKASADLLLRSFYRTHGYDVRITRCTNNYGPYQHTEKFIPTVLHSALAGKPIPIYGNGRQVRDWIHVDDHCEGILAVLDQGVAGGIYHFGGPEAEETTNIDLAAKLLRILAHRTGRDPDELVALVSHVDDRLGHDVRYALDWSESATTLGWRPRISLDAGLETTVDWYIGKMQHQPAA
jgi:dTDP-glucose 4,6-dehydratase